MSAKKVTTLSKVVDRWLYLEGMKREELARKVGMTPSYLSGILTGKQRLSIAASNAISDATGIDGKTLRRLSLELEGSRDAV